MPNPKHPTDPSYNPFEFRTGVGGTTAWRGSRVSGSTRSGKPGQIRACQNIRPLGDGYRERGGITKAIASAAAAGVDGMFDTGDDGGTYD